MPCLEIGPGRGALTRLLARTAGQLTLVEFDSALAAVLTAEFAAASNIEVRRADILALDITALAAGRGEARDGKLVIVGNLPYYITSEGSFSTSSHTTPPSIVPSSWCSAKLPNASQPHPAAAITEY